MSLTVLCNFPISSIQLKQSEWWTSNCELGLAALNGFIVCNMAVFWSGEHPYLCKGWGFAFSIPAYFVNLAALKIVMNIADFLQMDAQSQILLDRPISWLVTASFCTLLLGSQAFVTLVPIITVTALTSIFDYLTYNPSKKDIRSNFTDTQSSKLDQILEKLDKIESRIANLEKGSKVENTHNNSSSSDIKKNDSIKNDSKDSFLTEISFENTKNTIENFKENTEQHKLAVEAIKSFTEKLNVNENRPSKGIFIQGQAGTGKTHLVTAFCKKAQEAGKKVLFISPKDIAYKISLKYIGDTDRQEFINHHDVFILDDFNGQEKFLEHNLVQDIIINAHTKGNKYVLLTSNDTYKNFVRRSTPQNNEEKGDSERFVRRITEIFDKNTFHFSKKN